MLAKNMFVIIGPCMWRYYKFYSSAYVEGSITADWCSSGITLWYVRPVRSVPMVVLGFVPEAFYDWGNSLVWGHSTASAKKVWVLMTQVVPFTLGFLVWARIFAPLNSVWGGVKLNPQIGKNVKLPFVQDEWVTSFHLSLVVEEYKAMQQSLPRIRLPSCGCTVNQSPQQGKRHFVTSFIAWTYTFV